MPFNIDEFKATIDSLNGIAPASRFYVTIFVKQGNKLSPLVNRPEISFLAFSADIPGISLSTDYLFLNGYGRVNEIPIRPNISECDIGFYMDENNFAYKLFYTWINSVINMDGSSYKNGIINPIERLQSNDAFFDEVFYPEDYYADVNIKFFGNSGRQLINVQLIDAFPIELSGLGLDWNNADTTAINEVKLAFRSMKMSFTETGNL